MYSRSDSRNRGGLVEWEVETEDINNLEMATQKLGERVAISAVSGSLSKGCWVGDALGFQNTKSCKGRK